MVRLGGLVKLQSVVAVIALQSLLFYRKCKAIFKRFVTAKLQGDSD